MLCFQVAVTFSFSEWAIVIVASKSRHRSLPISSGPGSRPPPGLLAGVSAGCLHRVQVHLVDAVEHPPRRGHQGDRAEQLLTVGEHRSR